MKYRILIYEDEIVWKVADERFIWKNSARIWGGELEFDFNTYGVKGLVQKFTDEAFNHFGSKIKTIKVEWKQLPDFNNKSAKNNFTKLEELEKVGIESTIKEGFVDIYEDGTMIKNKLPDFMKEYKKLMKLKQLSFVRNSGKITSNLLDRKRLWTTIITIY
ncbi:hypothetical protein [Chryseobacterium profundimaris]|uniref:Uncharacterized protein n=1 Tax=Chryseobacterium profundimaris TaxID=1387275 RepID=A0ABY1PC72_9FLAO|nr:hypothetical protein [Chryseobacterium profundimaris]SMP30251.1 hypothetical protein SAMN06264346_112104 [Chryseobacterium profundimaris]